MKEFSTFQLVDILSETRAAIQQKIDKGIYQPSGNKAAGRGTKNLFTNDDVFKILLTRLLSDNGFSLEVSSRISRNYFTEIGNAIKNDLNLIIVRDINRFGYILLGKINKITNKLFKGHISDFNTLCVIQKKQYDWWLVEKESIVSIEKDLININATPEKQIQMTSIAIIDLSSIKKHVDNL